MLAGVSHICAPLSHVKLLPCWPTERRAHLIERRRHGAHGRGLPAFARGEGTETPVEANVTLWRKSFVRNGGTASDLIETADAGDEAPQVRPCTEACGREPDPERQTPWKAVRVTVVRTGEVVEITVDDMAPAYHQRNGPTRRPSYGWIRAARPHRAEPGSG